MGNLKATIIPVTVFQQNCTLLYDDETKEGVLVDPGGDWPLIAEAIKRTGVKVGAIWITHGHVDHAGGAMEAKENLNVPIIGSNIADKPLMENLVEKARSYRMTGIRNCTPDHWLEDGEILDCGGHKFEVFHTPGHAPGHVIYFNAEVKLALVGDVLFHNSIGRTDFPFCSYPDLIHSLKEKVLLLGDDVTFISGHGDMSTIGEEKRHNPFLQDI
ncbi:MBL fold metallo-hydrolase [uncultured Bartonella sp.]|uniref:MBL fold metallo-hydrolase n=1 Tax=uncultured Bartonella sp. TaxID=104108 RepID=UPI0025CDE85F|nr:MBL fold metallo-hydrolase [uncultured Bartonella sp.]